MQGVSIMSQRVTAQKLDRGAVARQAAADIHDIADEVAGGKRIDDAAVFELRQRVTKALDTLRLFDALLEKITCN